MRQEEIKDKLAGFAGFKKGGDLTLFLEKFEHVMWDCDFEKVRWASKLYAKDCVLKFRVW